MKTEYKKKFADNWFNYLQSQICKEFERLEKISSGKQNKFIRRDWYKENKRLGGGTSFILKNGNIFEKVGVNKSTVSGIFHKKFRSNILGANKNGKYWASGISVVAHMKNPKIPAIHFNTRFIVTSKEWFGGGIDATPSLKNLDQKKYFHSELKKMCNKHNKHYYAKYKKWGDEYFYLPHRNEARGIGGIFFDYKMDDWGKDFSFVRDVGTTFDFLLNKMIRENMHSKWTKKDKEIQLMKRGRYIEFNLLYDRGTKFGLNSGGNIESILMSLPPNANRK